MGCSKDRTIQEMVQKGMVNGPSLKLDGLPSSRLYDFIQEKTEKAKVLHDVDMGPLFVIRGNNVEVGNYSEMGNQSTKTTLQLQANEEAFEAIDRSQYMEFQRVVEEQNKIRNQMFQESAVLDKEANIEVVDGEVLPPDEFGAIVNRESLKSFNTTGLVEINIQC